MQRNKDTVDNKRSLVWWTNGNVFLILDAHVHTQHVIVFFFHTPCYSLSLCCLRPAAHQYSRGVGDVA